MVEIREGIKHEISLGIALIKQVVQNRGHPLDIIREALSNSCAREVKASFFKITIFYDGMYGWSFIFEDDGIGMDYTGEKEPEKQGRLDRFLNLAYSGVAGLDSDEFGFKGLGSKLMYLCKKLEIETKTTKGMSYKVVVDDIYYNLIEKKKPEMPIPIIYKDNPIKIDNGTIIKIYGYDNGNKHPEYENIDKLKQYLKFRTLIGYTKPERLRESFPKIIIKIKIPSINTEEEMKIGFPWIEKKESTVTGQKIGIIDPPIKITEKDKKGNEASIILKGGYVLKTGEFGLSGRSIFDLGVGLTYSWKGIPYFNLDFNRYKPRGFELYYKFSRFVVECEDVDTNIARSEINADGIKDVLFTKALIKAYRKVKDSDDYKEWVKHRRDLRKKELSISLNKRKEILTSKEQKWVYYKSDLVHKEPNNEHDLLALLWKLEGLKALPLHVFKSLEHTNKKGIDIIADYQETDISEMKLFQSIEAEHLLENYENHDYVPEQSSLIIAWDSKNLSDLIKGKNEWSYQWEYSDVKLNVILLKYIPDIEVKTK